MRRLHRTPLHGFTLVELMAVVTIIGVLAALATYSVSKYVRSSQVSEPLGMMAQIKSAQEAYKAETFRYLNVSDDFSLSSYYPKSTPDSSKTQWGGGNAALRRNWDILGVVPDAPVVFTYATVAAEPNTAPPEPNRTASTTWDFPAQNDWTYVAAAIADLDQDGTYCYVVSSSYTADVHVENRGD